MTLFLGGLGIFLIGMSLLERTLKDVFDRGLKKIIKQYASKTVISFLVGVVLTLILQSSTVVTMITLGFVGAGIFGLKQALGVIIGANVGTTGTPWLISLIGFSIDLDPYMYPLIFVGALGFVFGKHRSRFYHLGTILIACAFLILGLDLLKESASSIKSLVDMGMLLGQPLVLFVLGGLILTFVIQSSTASSVIILSFLYEGIFDPYQASALIIGANLGSAASTMLLGFLTSNYIKKQAAVGHLLFNIFCALIMGICFYPLMYLIREYWGWTAYPTYGIAIVHSLFNSIGAICILPFMRQATAMIERIVPEPTTQQHNLKLYTTDPVVIDAAIVAIHKDTITFAQHVGLYVSAVLGLPYPSRYHTTDLLLNDDFAATEYERIKDLSSDIVGYQLSVMQKDHKTDQHTILMSQQQSHQYFLQVAKLIKDIRLRFHEFEDEEYADIIRQRKSCISSLIEATLPLMLIKHTPATISQKLDEQIERIQRIDIHMIENISELIHNHDIEKREQTHILLTHRHIQAACESWIKAIRYMQ